MKKLSIIFLTVLLFSACKKGSDVKKVEPSGQTPPNITSLIIGGEVDPEGFIQAKTDFNAINGDIYNHFYAYFKLHPDDQNNVSVGNVVANSSNITFNSSQSNTYEISNSTNNWIGNTLNIDIAGNNGFVQQTITHPSLNQFTQLGLSNVTGSMNLFNKSNNLTLTWNAGNSADNVFIEIENTYNLSTNNFPTNTLKKYITVTDNGSYTIPSSFFNDFPSNSLCLVNIYRGNYNNYTATNNKHIGVLSYCKATNKIQIQ